MPIPIYTLLIYYINKNKSTWQETRVQQQSVTQYNHSKTSS